MKKYIVIIVIIICLIILELINIYSNKAVNIDIYKLAEELKNAQIFEDNLSEIDEDSIVKRYNFNKEKINQVVSYIGTGATAEEILIIKLEDKNDVAETKQIIESKIEERKTDFQNYLPKEVFKLENYNLETKKNYIILCISNNYDKSSEIINQYIK